MIANARWSLLGLPFTFIALVVAIDCSNSSVVGCPQQLTDLDVTAACSSEGFVCPYVRGTFDQNRVDGVGDCFTGFVEYTCTQKKWTLSAEPASGPCTIDETGALSASSCALGVGRCAVAATTLACQSACNGTGAYAASCVSGQFVVTPTSCVGALDAGDQEDAAAIDDASSDAGDD